MDEHFFEIKKNVRFSTLGNVKAKRLLIALHGYGQLSKYFIRKFIGLEEDWFVVAPEATHRFYLNGSSGRVGASWMTKELRDVDIAENNLLIESLLNTLLTSETYEEVVLLGFSQGGATASRYFYSNQNKINRLIVWASVFPPDIDKETIFNRSSTHSKNTFVLGANDMFFNENQQVEAFVFFEELGFKTKKFDGNHDIDLKTLQDIL